MVQDPLDYAPPVEEIPESMFGQYVPDGEYPMEIVGYQLHGDGSENAWVRAKIVAGPYQNDSEYSMNLFLPTQQALQRKAREKGNDREKALQAFFAYGQTCKRLQLKAGLSIKAALDAMVGIKFRGFVASRVFDNKRRTELVEIVSLMTPAAEGQPETAAAEPASEAALDF